MGLAVTINIRAFQFAPNEQANLLIEIEPVSEDMFDYFYDTQIKDYRLDPNQVIYE